MHTRAALVLAAVVAGPTALAADAPYPTRPVRLVVPFPPGSSTNDILARALAQRLAKALDQQIVIDNRSGAGGTLGTDIVAKAPPDGYTLVIGAAGTLAIAPAVFAKLPYDPQRDFAPVALFAETPYLMVVKNALPATTIKELIALAKAKPGGLFFGSSGTGGTPHLCGELFNTLAGVQMTHVPYKGGATAIVDLASGQLDMLCLGVTALAGPVKSGRARALGMATRERSALMPQLATITEQGLPGFEVNSWSAVMAPARTPPTVVRRLHAEIARIAASDEMKNFVLSQGSETAVLGPQELAAYLRADIAKWAKVVKAAKIAPE